MSQPQTSSSWCAWLVYTILKLKLGSSSWWASKAWFELPLSPRKKLCMNSSSPISVVECLIKYLARLISGSVLHRHPLLLHATTCLAPTSTTNMVYTRATTTEASPKSTTLSHGWACRNVGERGIGLEIGVKM